MAQQTPKVTPSGIGYLEYLPDGYHSNSNKYPVVISLHGIKEKGTSSTDPKLVLADLGKVANVGLPKYVKYGTRYPFILISPQLKSNYGLWSPAFIMQVLNHVKKTLRIDDRRIYLTGLSLGGFGVWQTVGEYPDVFAAVVAVCSGGNVLNKADAIAAHNVPVWAFHGDKDRTVNYSVTTKMVNAINSAPKKPNPLAKLTILKGMDHAIWDRVYKETNALDWMMGFRKGSAPPKNDDTNQSDNSTNKAPLARAGSDRTLVLPTNTIDIQGTADDPDGKIASFRWTQLSGAAASLSGTNTSRLRASNLREGSYIFQLTVTDDDGASHSDKMLVSVKRSGTNPPDDGTDDGPSSNNSIPFAYAGPDLVITLPTNSVTIQGEASDKDGKIVSYEWAKTYGNRASFSGANTSKVRIYDLEKGIYIFRLRVRDNNGGVKDDLFKITVNGSATGDDKNNSSENSIPYAYAGPDRVLTLPTNSVTIQATASDKDGRIVSYQWEKTYGHNASFSGDRTSKVTISNLERGIYIFRLTVKDDRGGVREDYFKITVQDRNHA